MLTPATIRNWTCSYANAVAYGGSALATNRAMLLALVGGLLTVPGVTVYQSCDSVSAGTAGDGVNRWLAAGNLVWNTPGSAHSWIALALPAGLRYTGGTGYLVLDLNAVSANGTAGNVYLAEALSAGSTTARPTGTKEVTISVGATLLATAPTSGYAWHLQHAVRDPIASGDVAEVLGIRAFMVDLSSGLVVAGLVVDAIAVADADPSFVGNPIGAYDFQAGSSEAFAPANLSNTPTFRTWVSASVDLNAILHYWDGNILEDGAGMDSDSSGRLILYPARLSAGFGYFCTLVDWYFCDSATLYSLATPATGDTAQAWVTFGNVAVPHTPGGANPLGSAASREMVALLEATRTEMVSLTPVGDTALASTRDAARWTPIVITLSAAGGTPLVMGHFGSDPGIRHVIYDGTAFTPFFEDRSTVTRSGDLWTFSTLPLGGWFDSPTVRAGVWTEAA